MGKPAIGAFTPTPAVEHCGAFPQNIDSDESSARNTSQHDSEETYNNIGWTGSSAWSIVRWLSTNDDVESCPAKLSSEIVTTLK